jgi:hypothetical protein
MKSLKFIKTFLDPLKWISKAHDNVFSFDLSQNKKVIISNQGFRERNGEYQALIKIFLSFLGGIFKQLPM